MTKQTKWLCAQRRLRSAWASAQSDQSLRCALSGYPRTQAFFMRTAKTDQTGRKPRLIWVFARRTCHFVGFVMRLICVSVSEKEPLTDAESKTLFRNLVTGQVMPDLSYAFHKFSFQTVFYMTNYHYCCCPCAYEHEYLEYLSNDRKIKQEIYERVETSIVRGRCPHVDKAPTLSITETAIYGSHIATVLRLSYRMGEKADPFYSDLTLSKRTGNTFVDIRTKLKRGVQYFSSVLSKLHWWRSVWLLKSMSRNTFQRANCYMLHETLGTTLYYW